MITHVRVTAAEGREVPIAAATATAPGGDLLRIKPGDTVRLPWDGYVRRRWNAGDLVLLNKGGTPVKNPADAAYPEEEYQADLAASAAAEKTKAEAEAKAAAQAKAPDVATPVKE